MPRAPGSPASSTSSSSVMKKPTSFKCLIIGSASVGKTSLLRQFVYHTFDAKGTQATIGCDFCQCSVAVPNAQTGTTEHLKMALWDTAGMEQFQSLSASFFRGASGCALVYDITNKASFEHARTWRDMFIQHAGRVPILLIGNKLDLASEDTPGGSKREVTAEAGVEFVQQSGGAIVDAVELSASDPAAVEAAFVRLGAAMLAHEATASASSAAMMSQSDIRRVRVGSIPPPAADQKKDCAC